MHSLLKPQKSQIGHDAALIHFYTIINLSNQFKEHPLNGLFNIENNQAEYQLRKTNLEITIKFYYLPLSKIY